MTSLALQIEAAQAANLKKLAAEVGTPKQELDTEALIALRHFAEYAKSRGVKYLPCAPTTVAAFIRSESAIGVTPERILSALRAIEQAHDSAGLPNPVACAAPRLEMARILKSEGPRSWNKSERLVFAGLAPEVQAIILRHAKLDSDAVRRAQNETAELRKQIQPKENDSNVRQEES